MNRNDRDASWRCGYGREQGKENLLQAGCLHPLQGQTAYSRGPSIADWLMYSIQLPQSQMLCFLHDAASIVTE